MKRLLAIFSAIGLTLPAQAETWYLVVGGSIKYKDASLSYLIPMESQTQCEVAGSKLVASAKDGSLDKADVNKLGFVCVTGK